MTNESTVLPIEALPRARWVAASSVYEGGNATPAVEWPAAYRLGFETPLTPPEYAAFLHHLNAQSQVEQIRLHHLAPATEIPLLHGSLTVDQDDTDGAAQVFEVVVADVLQHRLAIRQIKQVVRPLKPYTAFTVVWSQPMSGNSRRAWVVVRDELTDDERRSLGNRMDRLRQVLSVRPCGRSSFELRLEARTALAETRFAQLLGPLGIRHDFHMESSGAETFEQAVRVRAAM